MIPEDQIIDIITVKPTTALEYLIFLRESHLTPLSKEKPATKDTGCTPPTNSELRRWCRDSSVVINGARVKHDDIVNFPVTSLVFFPKSKTSKCTIL